MASVTVPVQQFRDGAFPTVCALTGAPTTTSRNLVVVRRGSLGGAAQARRRRVLGRGGLSRVRGPIPLSAAAARRTAILEWSRAGLAAVAVVGFAVGMFSSLALLLAATGLAILLGVSLFFSVGGELDREGENVRLLHVHPDFVSAVQRHEWAEV